MPEQTKRRVDARDFDRVSIQDSICSLELIVAHCETRIADVVGRVDRGSAVSFGRVLRGAASARTATAEYDGSHGQAASERMKAYARQPNKGDVCGVHGNSLTSGEQRNRSIWPKSVVL